MRVSKWWQIFCLWVNFFSFIAQNKVFGINQGKYFLNGDMADVPVKSCFKQVSSLLSKLFLQ